MRRGYSGSGDGSKMPPPPPARSGAWVWTENVVSPPSTMTVWPGENPEVGRLYGPKGELVKVIRARPEVPVGFRP